MALDPKIRINLERSVVMLADGNPTALEALTGMVRGFGVRKQFKCKSGAEAMHIVKTQELDLIIMDSIMPDMDGYDFLRWLRREAQPEAQFTPVIMLSGHAARSTVEKSRDSGSNFVIAKPFTPELLLQRIFWVAKDERQMVKAENYVGPDRRFKNLGPPLGMKGRRKGDLSGTIGAATDPNMDQNDIDMLLKPSRVAL
ncbi:response regulator [Phenylobacterium aquaticum]|uniref:response regulator n=1 Tax=Phenylobacterium aquaticum TaxID=1763816 RepID=UPI001F5E2D7A|nr:response regulator [Phenylobacterium aquaticum]MCI3131723.1 response regulator [Phenylobacterium aquaticum]